MIQSSSRFDLAIVATNLRQESQSREAGHRQETLYKQGPTSISLFLFSRLAQLPPHRTQGVVSIHLLEGHLQVTAEGEVHDLHANHLLALALAPGVQHDVVALQDSEMLLTVNRVK